MANQQIRYSSFFCSTSSSLADKLQKETNIKKRQHGSAACVCVFLYACVVCLPACVCVPKQYWRMWQLDGRSIGRHGNTARRHRHVLLLLLLLLPPSLFHTHHTHKHQRGENSCWKISTCAYHTHTCMHYEVWARTRRNDIIYSNLNRKT